MSESTKAETKAVDPMDAKVQKSIERAKEESSTQEDGCCAGGGCTLF
jgi:hypothetical protein